MDKMVPKVLLVESSGVKTQEEVVKVVCSDMKIGHKYRYVVLGLINNMTEIGVIKKAPMDATFDNFIEDMLEAEEQKCGRYAVYDFPYVTKDQQNNSKLVFIIWAPDSLPVRAKMLISASKDNVRKQLDGILVDHQANFREDLDAEEIAGKCL